MKKIVFIGGPTASGKTSIAVHLAKKFKGEIINADSRQIYKHLDIGTNKDGIISSESGNLIENIPIHLVSFLDPNSRYSVYEFKNAALEQIEQIINRGNLPIIVGGTGLYIDSIIKNYTLAETGESEVRKSLEQKTLEELIMLVENTAPEEYQRLNQSDKKNLRRLIRLIEKLSTPQKLTEIPIGYDYLFLYPEFSWDELVVRIENRVDKMFEEGIINEVQKVLKMGFPDNSVALQGTGYKEVIMFLRKQIDLAECIRLVKTSHRQYAKRQRTWFEGEGRGYKLVKVKNTLSSEEIVLNFINLNPAPQDY